jgi:hypothetical protein
MVGGVFEATNGDEITGPYTTLYTVTSEPPISTWTEITLSNATTPYKYARYRAAGWCNVAEIEFYSGNNQLSGTVYGTAGSWNNSGLDYTKVFEETITG